MVRHNKKSDTHKDPLAELKRLQTQLASLRDKHLEALERQLQVVEKKIESQKLRVDRLRADVQKAEHKLGNDPKPSKRAVASVEKARQQFASQQAELAELRSDCIALKLDIRREQAVIKAIADVERSLKAPKPTASAKAAAKAPAKANTAAKKEAPKAKPNPRPKKPSNPKPAAAQTSPAGTVAPTAEPAAANGEPTSPSPDSAAVTSKRPATARKSTVKRNRPPRPMSDIPSHPDKPEDRLASLFDDF